MKVAIGTFCIAVLLVLFWMASDSNPQMPPASTALPEVSGVPGNAAPYQGDAAKDYLARLSGAELRSSGEELLLKYKPEAGPAGRLALDEILFKGIRPTPRTASTARSLLNGGQLSNEERVTMIAIVASLHNQDNATGLNAEIESDLKRLAIDPDKSIAGEAAVSYARLGYIPGTEEVLRKALRSGALTTDSYYREIAHLVANAPLEKKKEFLLDIRGASNELATDILTESLLSGEEFNAAPFLRDSEDMAKLLAGMEPNLGANVAQYGMVDVIRYRNWLRATALLESQKTGEPMDVIIVRRLSEPGTDPRKIMGYLSAPEARPMLASAGVDSPVQDLVRIAQGNADQHPASRDMRDVMSEIRLRMKAPPPVPPPAVFERPMPIGGPVPSQGG